MSSIAMEAESHDQAILSEARKTIETTVETITPKKAAEWIAKVVNCHNRLLNNRKVMQYARDMEQGRWKFANDAICFDRNGVLLNGQHRLHACTVSNKSFKNVVIRGMPPETQDVMDQGGARSIAGILQLRNYANTTRLAGAMRAVINLVHAEDGYNSYRPTNAEVLALLDDHPHLVDSVAVAYSCRGISPALLAAIHYIGKNLLNQAEKADAFVQVINTGVPAYPRDPAHLLRENTLRHNERKTSKQESVKFFSMIRAYNAFVDGESWGKWAPPRPGANPSLKGLKPEMI